MLLLIKRIFQLIALLLVIAALTIVCFILFFNPSNYKQEINDFLQEYTGQPVQVTGPIKWSFGQAITFNLQNLTLASPSGFKSPILDAKEANLTIDLFSLFGDDLIITGLEIKGLTLTIEKLANGTENIDILTNSNAGYSNNNKLDIDTLSVQNSSIIFHDEQDNRHWALNNANITAKNLRLNPLEKLDPISVKGDLTNLDNNLVVGVDAIINTDIQKKTIVLEPILVTSGAAKLKGKALIDQLTTEPIISGDLTLEEFDLAGLINNISPGAPTDQITTPSKLQGQITYSYYTKDQILELSQVYLQRDEAIIKGDLKLALSTPQKANFNLTLDKVNLKPLFGLLMMNLPPIESLKTMTVAGKISGSDVRFGAEFLINHVTTDFSIDNGIIIINPIVLSAYESNHSAGVTIDLTKETPAIKITEQATHTSLEPWAKLLSTPIAISGIAEIKLSVDASGNDTISLLQTATGGLNMVVKDGTFNGGIDLDKLLQYTANSITDIFVQLADNKTSNIDSLAKLKAADWMSTQRNSPSTGFQSMQIKAEFTQGAGSASITMNNVGYELKGNSKFALADKKVIGEFTLANKNDKPSSILEANSFIKNTPLALSVSGTIDQLAYNPALQDYMLTIVKQTEDALLKKAVTKMVIVAGPSQNTTKSAEELFVESLRGLKN